MPLKIFHTADLHLDMKFPQFSEVRSLLKMARFDTLDKMVRLANEHACDLFVIAGDLFDRLSIPREVITRTANILRGFKGRLVAVLPGNHDFVSFGQSELWRSFQQFTSKNILVLDRQQVYDLRSYGLNAALYPAPCYAKHSPFSSIQWIRDLDKGPVPLYHIGIAHGSLKGFSPDTDERCYLMQEHELLQCSLDLWLLGHTHIQYPRPGESSSGKVFYPGIPEPRGFECTQEGRAWIIQIDDMKEIHENSVAPGRYRFMRAAVDAGSGGLAAIKSCYSSPLFKHTLLQLKLMGKISPGEFSLLAPVREEIRKSLFYLQWDHNELDIELTLDEINREYTEGSFPHRILTALASGREHRALRLAFELMGGGKK